MFGSELLFKGEFKHQLDDKVRFKLPVKMEEAFEDLGVKCVLMKMPENCLAIYPAKIWEKEYASYLDGSAKKQMGNAKFRKLSRLLASRSVDIKIGAQGRVALPDSYKEYIGVSKKEDVMIIGAGDRIEVWNVDAWNDDIDGLEEEFFDLLESAVEVDRAADVEREDG